MTHVFISYKRDSSDAELAELLYHRLAAAGFDPFLDNEIEPGARWSAEIERQLSQADVFLVLMKMPHRDDCHYVELMSRQEISYKIQGTEATLDLEIPAGEVVAVAQLPKILAVQPADTGIAAPRMVVRILRPIPNARLVLLEGTDPHNLGREVELKDQRAAFDASAPAQGRGDLALQLFSDELADQVRVR